MRGENLINEGLTPDFLVYAVIPAKAGIQRSSSSTLLATVVRLTTVSREVTIKTVSLLSSLAEIACSHGLGRAETRNGDRTFGHLH